MSTEAKVRMNTPSKEDRRQISVMKPRYEQILNWLIDNPTRPVADCAAYFNVTPKWMYIIINSDAFRARLLERQDECFNATVADLREKTHGAAHEALDLFMTKIHMIEDPMKLLKAVDTLFDKLGYGAKANIGSPKHYIQHNTTVNMTTSPEQLTQARDLMDRALALRAPRDHDPESAPVPSSLSNPTEPDDSSSSFPEAEGRGPPSSKNV